MVVKKNTYNRRSHHESDTISVKCGVTVISVAEAILRVFSQSPINTQSSFINNVQGAHEIVRKYAQKRQIHSEFNRKLNHHLNAMNY